MAAIPPRSASAARSGSTTSRVRPTACRSRGSPRRRPNCRARAPAPPDRAASAALRGAQGDDVVAGEARAVEGLAVAVVANPGAAARSVGHRAAGVEHVRAAARTLDKAFRGAQLEIVAAADVSRVPERVHAERARIVPRAAEPAGIIRHPAAVGVVLQRDQADIGGDVAVVDPAVQHPGLRPGEHAVRRVAVVVGGRERPPADPVVFAAIPAAMRRGDDDVLAADYRCRAMALVAEQLADRLRRLRVSGLFVLGEDVGLRRRRAAPEGQRGDRGGDSQTSAIERRQYGDHLKPPSLQSERDGKATSNRRGEACGLRRRHWGSGRRPRPIPAWRRATRSAPRGSAGAAWACRSSRSSQAAWLAAAPRAFDTTAPACLTPFPPPTRAGSFWSRFPPAFVPARPLSPRSAKTKPRRENRSAQKILRTWPPDSAVGKGRRCFFSLVAEDCSFTRRGQTITRAAASIAGSRRPAGSGWDGSTPRPCPAATGRGPSRRGSSASRRPRVRRG